MSFKKVVDGDGEGFEYDQWSVKKEVEKIHFMLGSNQYIARTEIEFTNGATQIVEMYYPCTSFGVIKMINELLINERVSTQNSECLVAQG